MERKLLEDYIGFLLTGLMTILSGGLTTGFQAATTVKAKLNFG